MTTSNIPQLGTTTPAVLATDDVATIEKKLHSFLGDVRRVFDERHNASVESGEAELREYAPGANISVPVAYVDEASAGDLNGTLNTTLQVFIAALPGHGFYLQDIEEWRRVDLTDEEDNNPFGHTIGAAYRIRVGDRAQLARYKELTGEEWIESSRKYHAGELTHRDSSGGGGSLAELLRALGK